MVRFLPPDPADAEGWAQSLLTDLAGLPVLATELLEAVRDVQAGRLAEWSTNYNAYEIEVGPDGAIIHFINDSCQVPLTVLAAVVSRHLTRLK